MMLLSKPTCFDNASAGLLVTGVLEFVGWAFPQPQGSATAKFFWWQQQFDDRPGCAELDGWQQVRGC